MYKYVILGLLFIITLGCSGTSEIDEKPNYSDYKLPEAFEATVFEVSTIDGYEAEMHIIEPEKNTESNYDRWLAAKEISEQQDKYSMMRHMWEVEHEENFAEREEERIEEYCKDYGYARCKDIEKTCDDEGCHRVTVECDDDNYNEAVDKFDECRRFEVQVDHEIDDELTAETDEEENKPCYY